MEGIACGSDNDCPEGSDQSSRTGAFIGLVIIGAVLRLVFWVKYYIEYKVKESENVALSHVKEGKTEISDAAVQRLTSVDNRPLLAHLRNEKAFVQGGENEADSATKSPIASLSMTSDDAPPPAPADVEDGTSSDSYNIKFENVGLTLPSGVTIMKGVSGEFKPKRMCAIMGPSGAG